MITLCIVNRFEKYSLRLWNIASLLQELLTHHNNCSNCPPLAHTKTHIPLISFAINICTLFKCHILNVVNSWIVNV